MRPEPLDRALIAAHNAGDRRGLVGLYRQAADEAGDLDATCFFLTQAHVFALETGHPEAGTILNRLRHYRRA